MMEAIKVSSAQDIQTTEPKFQTRISLVTSGDLLAATRLRQAQAEVMAPIDLISCLVSDELTRRTDLLLERRRKQARFRDPDRTLDNFDFTFNPKMNRSLVFDLATGAFFNKREDALFPGVRMGSGWSATPSGDGSYVVSLDFINTVAEREQHEKALWEANIATKTVLYLKWIKHACQ
jgi:hypothetical protein